VMCRVESRCTMPSFVTWQSSERLPKISRMRFGDGIHRSNGLSL